MIFALVVALLLGFVWAVFWWRDWNYVRKLSLEELENQAFRFENEYFEFLGTGNKAVIRFQSLIESRDLPSLRREWKGLERNFRRLERKAGHKDRPLIFDYYGAQSTIFTELSRRLGE